MTFDIKKLLSTTPETLAEQQREALIVAVQQTFSKFVSHLQKRDFASAEAMLADSPSGDGHGCDNRCLSFDHVMDSPAPGCFTDIGDILDRLKSLSGLRK